MTESRYPEERNNTFSAVSFFLRGTIAIKVPQSYVSPFPGPIKPRDYRSVMEKVSSQKPGEKSLLPVESNNQRRSFHFSLKSLFSPKLYKGTKKVRSERNDVFRLARDKNYPDNFKHG